MKEEIKKLREEIEQLKVEISFLRFQLQPQPTWQWIPYTYVTYTTSGRTDTAI